MCKTKNLFILTVSLLASGCVRDSAGNADHLHADTLVKAKKDSGAVVASEPQDSGKKQRYIPPEISEEAMQRALIRRRDSSFNVYSNIRADYRIIGYEAPDTNARKMILFSVFTSDVENNPFECPYGSYYDSAQGDRLVLKYIGEHGSFIEVHISGSQRKPATVYFQKKWVEFDDERD